MEFPGILEAFDAVCRYLEEEEKAPNGSPREVYFAAWDASGGEATPYVEQHNWVGMYGEDVILKVLFPVRFKLVSSGSSEP